MTGDQVARIPSGRLRQLGPVNWVLAKLGARAVRAPEMHLFTTLGYRQSLFWAWLIYGGRLLRGRLPRIDTELVILRVAHLRSCEYELQHHRRMARAAGLDAQTQATIFAWPDVPGATGPEGTQRAAAGVVEGDRRVDQGPVDHHRNLAAAGDPPQTAAADRILHARNAIRRARGDDNGAQHSVGQPALAV
ncbi:carboxymuconolactone decarboxylase family protein [Mycobacterium kansasii 824]|nr:carboxymuconolactone decarboxylase family protein [Mycobacterium kansasii 824]